MITDQNPIKAPPWLMTSVWLGSGMLFLFLAVGVLGNLFAPRGAVTQLPETLTNTPATVEPTSPVEKQTREITLEVLRTQCQYNLKGEIAEVNEVLVTMRGIRWLIYAQKEAPPLGLTTYEFLMENYVATVEKIYDISNYGSFNPLPKQSRELRDLLGTVEDITWALTSGTNFRHPNVSLVELNTQLQDCQAAARTHNSVLQDDMGRAGFGGQLP
jgi:hypothetical protein